MIPDKCSAKDLLFAVNIGLVNVQHYLDKLQRELHDTMADVQLLCAIPSKGDTTINLRRMRELHVEIGPRAAKRILDEFGRVGKMALTEPFVLVQIGRAKALPRYSTVVKRLHTRKPNHRTVQDVPGYKSHC